MFCMDDEIKNTILESIKQPAKASGDSGSVEQHKLKDMIEADKYLASKEAAKKPSFGIGFIRWRL